MIESEQQAAENAARKRHGSKKGSADKFVATERLRVLGLHLKEDIRRFREPANVKNKVNSAKQENVDQTLGASFFQLKTK